MLKRDLFGRLVEPQYCDMRRLVLARIASGQLTEDSDLSKVLDSLELVELTMEAEESGVEPAVQIKTRTMPNWITPDTSGIARSLPDTDERRIEALNLDGLQLTVVTRSRIGTQNSWKIEAFVIKVVFDG